jgi:hypothetical protein
MNFLIFVIQNMKFGPGNNNQDLLSPSWPGYLIFFQHMGLNIEEHQKLHFLGNFGVMRVSISENIQKIDFSGLFTKILIR